MKSICFSIFKYIFWKYFFSYLHLLIFIVFPFVFIFVPKKAQIYISDNTNTNTNNNGKEAFSLSNDSNFPPPLPSQSTQLTSSVQANFPIPDALNTFAHFDVQSVFFHFERAKLVKEALSLPQNNMRTGASAASRPANPECDKSLPNRLLKSSHAGSLKCRSGINSISSTLGSLEQSSSVDEENIAGNLLRGENRDDMSFFEAD